jgi:hypothetical protein
MTVLSKYKEKQKRSVRKYEEQYIINQGIAKTRDSGIVSNENRECK